MLSAKSWKVITLLFTAVLAFVNMSVNVHAHMDDRQRYEAAPQPFEETKMTLESQVVESIEEPSDARYNESDVIMLAKMVWGETRDCSVEEQRLVIWTVFHRVDASGWFGSTISKVITKPNQFKGYRVSYPVITEIYELCAEEIIKWLNGEDAPLHELYAPSRPYYFFDGDGTNNWFREAWKNE